MFDEYSYYQQLSPNKPPNPWVAALCMAIICAIVGWIILNIK